VVNEEKEKRRRREGEEKEKGEKRLTKGMAVEEGK